MDNLLCSGPLDSAPAPSPADSAPHLPHDLPANNSPCDAQEDLTEDTDISATVVEENGVAAVDPDTLGDAYDPEPLRLSPHLPQELCGLPRSEISPLCCDAGLALSACCVHTDRSSLFVVFVSTLPTRLRCVLRCRCPPLT